MSSALRTDVLDAALACASALVGMEVALVIDMEGDRIRYARVRGGWPGLEEGYEGDRSDTLCALMLDEGAPPATADAARDPIYSRARDRTRLGLTSYVGVPVRNRRGDVVATLCCLDRGSVEVTDGTIGVLEELATIVATQLEPEVVIRRTPAGWVVGDEEAPSLVGAMVLADLLAEDLAPPHRPAKAPATVDETERLRTAVLQLEHALAARVVVEQALGVLAERLHVSPREAFELTRRIARRSGIRVHDLARDVVASVGDPSVSLPAELTAPA